MSSATEQHTNIIFRIKALVCSSQSCLRSSGKKFPFNGNEGGYYKLIQYIKQLHVIFMYDCLL